MKNITVLFLIFLFIQAVQAADTNPPPRLTVELRDGSRVVGESAGKYFRFHSALLGEIKLAPKDLRAVECLTTNSAKLTTASGDTLTVSFADSALGVKTSFGRVELAAGSIRKLSVTVAGAAGLRPGLVALWSGEDSGKDSAGNHDLELTDVSFAEGQVGRAFVMNGSSSCMKLADAAGLNPGTGDGLTLSAWIKPNNVYGFHPILEWNPSGKLPGIIGVQLWIGNVPGSQGVLSGQLVGDHGETHSLISPPGTVVAGRFQQVAVTYDKATGAGALYVNGVVVARGSWGRFEPLTTGDLWVSRRPTDHPGDWTYNAFFSGLLDEISIYNRALSAAEIKAVGIEENHGEPLPPPLPRPFLQNYRNGSFGEGFR